ncbi:Beta subunit 1 of SnRK1 [Datura stramonium]|uniref:Beta subunit 1 of SnRK1 n=1 Tax=Datura stramonium TaxID=4076 RepID=A0ABS8SFB1_DATST|nr:Beta subunit 1 of SnRK1 [Datura stramonium]
MGNASGREDGAAAVVGGGGGGDDEVSGRRSNVESGKVEDHALTSRVPSADLMVNSPPQSPHRSASIPLVRPQVGSLHYRTCLSVCLTPSLNGKGKIDKRLRWSDMIEGRGNGGVPVVPLQDDPVTNQMWGWRIRMFDHSPGSGIPTLITWSHGGNNVAVQGSWDNWRSRKILQRSGKDHTILLVLPSGIYHYKFIVDGEVRYIPELPCVADETGIAFAPS